MKTCIECNEEKTVEDFPKTGGPKCRKCKAEYYREWRKNNPERTRELSKRSTEKLRERNPAYFREWYAKKYATERGRAHYSEINNRRRALHKNAPGKYTAEEFLELCELFGNVCLACGEETQLTADHVIPLAKGGSNDISNIQPLCRSCNSKKHTQSTDFRPKLAL